MKMIPIGLIAIAVIVVAIAIRPQFARAELLKEGQIAPPFSTQMVTGEQVAPMALADFHGRKVVLYFYPKDETSGCTKEASSFRDGYPRYTNARYLILRYSLHSAHAHNDFIPKNPLPYSPLPHP